VQIRDAANRGDEPELPVPFAGGRFPGRGRWLPQLPASS
jgi:hypothetical protein